MTTIRNPNALVDATDPPIQANPNVEQADGEHFKAFTPGAINIVRPMAASDPSLIPLIQRCFGQP